MQQNLETIVAVQESTASKAKKRNCETEQSPENNDAKRAKLVVAQQEDVSADASQVATINDNKEKQYASSLNLKPTVAHQSPRKRLQLQQDQQKPKEKFIYGNYKQYYNYRNKSFQDVRLEMMATQAELLANKDVLDIGCNSGVITMEVAKQVKSIVGLDIDGSLIKQAIANVVRCKKALPIGNAAKESNKFPFNIHFVHGNYVLKDDVLLEIETEQFDVILCLSVTKWIQLNFGDAGLKQAFRRMYAQLRHGGKLILEAQPIDNYGRRKRMSDAIFANYKAMQFLPKHFDDYLLGAEVGFASMQLLGVPEHCVQGFKRPIQVFCKH